MSTATTQVQLVHKIILELNISVFARMGEFSSCMQDYVAIMELNNQG